MSTPKRKKEQRAKRMAADKLLAERKKELLASKLAKAKRQEEFKEYVPTEPYRPDRPEYPSLKTKEYNTFKLEDKQYTGDYITGIATAHKSNLVPVSRGIDPTDYATMRR